MYVYHSTPCFKSIAKQIALKDELHRCEIIVILTCGATQDYNIEYEDVPFVFCS